VVGLDGGIARVTGHGRGGRDDVHYVAVDDEVAGWLQDWSAHAEYAAVPARQLIPRPRALPWDVAGSLFVTPMAGLADVQAVAPLKNDVIVIAGGVGLTAVRLARRAGATVIGIAGPANADPLVQFGAGRGELRVPSPLATPWRECRTPTAALPRNVLSAGSSCTRRNRSPGQKWCAARESNPQPAD
jgi:hypothetical protein